MAHLKTKTQSSVQPKLLDQVRAKIRTKHYSRRTEDCDNKPWQSERKKIPPEKIMNIRIAIDEVEARSRVKKAGGRWDPKRRVWQLSYEKVIELGLASRIIDVGLL